MRTLFGLLIALPLLAVAPASGQDILGPIQDFVDTLTAPQAPPRTVPKAEPEAPMTPPPVPRPRPPSLPDMPVVEQPIRPAITTEPEPEAETETVAPEPVAEPEPAPEPEPERVYQVACPAVIMGLVEAEMAPPLSDGMCGEHSPLVVTGVMSRGRMVPLSSPVTTNCQMATALPSWVEDVDGYAEAMLGSRLASISTGPGYMCRNRNNASEGFTSEHGFANAVDVMGFTLEDGSTVAVESNWLPAAEPQGRLLRLAHDAACGGFMTVLGPEANADHHNHIHLDLGCHGASCTTRICE